MRRNQTIAYDDNNEGGGKAAGLFDKMLAGFSLQKFGNFFRGESPKTHEPLKSERGAPRSQGLKPPLYLEKRQSQQVESEFLQRQATLQLQSA